MASMACDPAQLTTFVLRLADSPLILGQRLGELVGTAPTLEEETALANIALDLLGQSQLLLEYVAKLRDDGSSADDLAFLREQHEYLNLLVVERPVDDFAQTIARNLYYASWAAVMWSELLQSSDAELAAIAAKAQKENAYHLRHAAEWVTRLGDGTDVSRARMIAALSTLWPYAGEAFVGDDIDDAMADAGVMPHCETLEESWRSLVGSVLDHATLDWPTGSWTQTGGKQGRHTEALGYVLAEMQYLPRTYPGATW